jgi:hypothetical protein
MTTPYERLRALRWGSEMLALITSDLFIQGRLMKLAEQLVAVYPDPDVISHRLRSDATRFPSEWVSMFNEAAGLFWLLTIEGYGSEDTRRCLWRTRLHYPGVTADNSVLSMFNGPWHPSPHKDGEFEPLR